MSQLVLRYFASDDGCLDVAVISDKFSGHGGFWIHDQDVRVFGEELSTYPIRPEAPLTVAWGYEMLEGENLVVGVEIVPENSRGDLRVRVELADYTERSERVRTSFQTTYAELDRFRTAIAALMDRMAEEAILRGR
ncbi:hypothetical protein [Aquibium oceanicum]|nr:hypothetical protein [Aquibium oceanicum]